MKLFIGADHRGFSLKQQLLSWLKQMGKEISDCGAFEFNSKDDYPDFAFDVAENVAQQQDALGLVICGSGVGVTIAANKVRGIRAISGCNLAQIEHGREADNINILAIGADYVNFDLAKQMIKTFLQSQPQTKERFLRRLEKIAHYHSHA